MNPGPLFKAVLISFLMGAAGTTQSRPAAASPGAEAETRTAPSSFASAQAQEFQQNQPAQDQASPSPTPSLPSLPANANDFVRLAIEHELAEEEQDHTHWRYRLHREDEKNNSDRDVIETSEGCSLSRTLLIWGRPLTAEEQSQDQERMRRLVTDPQERAHRAKREKEDEEKVHKMLHAISQAFIFKYDGEEDGLVRLSFIPAAHWDPPALELRVFRSLTGHLWIDRASNRLARIDGVLFEDVSFGFGLLGRLYKGGTFRVEQKEVGDGHWDVVSEEVNMLGRAVLFKTITRKQKETLTDFRRVPDSTTLSQAFEMLEKDSGGVSANGSHAALQSQGKN